jgi:hypothetical protein
MRKIYYTMADKIYLMTIEGMYYLTIIQVLKCVNQEHKLNLL